MIVSELITLLQQQPQDMPVVVAGVAGYPVWPEPERKHALFIDGEPKQQVVDADQPGVLEVIWL